MSKSDRLFRVMHLFRCLPAPVTAARFTAILRACVLQARGSRVKRGWGIPCPRTSPCRPRH